MRATAADVQTIMQLIRLEDTSTETTGIITRHVGAAEIFLRNAGGIEPDYTNDMYLDLVAQYVGIKYDAPEGVGGAALFNPTFIGQIEQVRLALRDAPDPENPVDPDDPDDPADPDDPVDPDYPVDPDDPVDPENDDEEVEGA